MENFRNQLGYVTGVDGLHICGYERQAVLYQDNSNGVGKMRRTKLYKNTKGTYFHFKGKAVYVELNK